MNVDALRGHVKYIGHLLHGRNPLTSGTWGRVVLFPESQDVGRTDPKLFRPKEQLKLFNR
jgi:hypothetical protein